MKDVRISRTADYIDQLRNGESAKSISERAGVAYGSVYNLLSRKKLPRIKTLKKIGVVVGANEVTLLKLSGNLEVSNLQIKNQYIIDLAFRMDLLPPSTQEALIDAFNKTLDAIDMQNSK